MTQKLILMYELFQTNQTILKSAKTKGGDAFLVNYKQSVLSRSQLGHKLITS